MPCFIAAGGTVVNVLEDIISRGGDPSKITIVCVVACPPALKKLSEKFPGTTVHMTQWMHRITSRRIALHPITFPCALLH